MGAEELLADLDDIATYGAGWDGEGADAPSKASIEQARALIKTMFGSPVVTIHANGNIMIEGDNACMQFLGNGYIVLT